MLRPLMVDAAPHWQRRFPKEVWPAFEDFRNLLILVWDHLGLPSPTEEQLEIAHRLQWGMDSHELSLALIERTIDEIIEDLYDGHTEDIIRAYRAIGKSYITSAYVIWRLMRNPRDEKILVVSATGSKAHEFVDQTKGVLQSMPLVMWLLQGSREGGARRRDLANKFDVAGASISQSYSVKAVGIDGQIAGSRSTLIIPDDIEIPKNSLTEDARTKIYEATREFDVVGKTEHGRADIKFLGTPQTEESIYNRLVTERGLSCFTIPVRYPEADRINSYKLTLDNGRTIDIIAPHLHAKHEAGLLDNGALTDPARFTIGELAKEEAKGRAYFALQMMLDTSLSDADRYPLRQQDLIIMPVNHDKAPLTIQWGRHSDGKNVVGDISNVGFSGDHFLRPLFVDQEWREYDGTVLWVDPAGRGKDETSWTVLAQLGGTLFVLANRGVRGDPKEAMLAIAQDAKAFNVNVIEVEPNFGQGIWIEAFKPILVKIWNDPTHKFLDPEVARMSAALAKREKNDGKMSGCTIQESEWAVGQKEARVIDTLEPVMTTHRLVVDETLVRKDIAAIKREDFDKQYGLFYQLTHLTRERKSLKHDDRIESLAGAVGHFMNAMAMDSQQERKARLDEEKDREIEDFLAMFEDGGSIGSLGFRRRGKRRADGHRPEVFQYRG